MNLAIIIGVSNYTHVSPLPGCAADVQHMRDLLVATGKYSSIVCINHHTQQRHIKSRLDKIVADHKSKPIDELFVYFSGHGVFDEQALLCCSDYHPQRARETSIENDYLDEVIRLLNPQLAVKVIDACQSGEPYIKGPNEAFKQALHKRPLGAFICMASSRHDQVSMATAQGSIFTQCWIDAALCRSRGVIRYTDIQRYLALSFVNDLRQQPYFVSQGSALEAFAEVTLEMNLLFKARRKQLE